MHESVDVDENLLDAALCAGGTKTKKETVDLVLREFVRKRRAKELVLLSLFGTIDYDASYDYKQERTRA